MNTQKLNDEMFGKKQNHVALVLLIGLIVLVLLAVFTVKNVHALADGGAGWYMMTAGTGECGYFQNVGVEHRNGLVTPSYCDKGNEAFNPVVEEQGRLFASLTVTADNGNGNNSGNGGDNSHPTVTHNPHTPPTSGGDNNSKKAKSNNGNHYGNDKGDNNCKDQKNSHNTCH